MVVRNYNNRRQSTPSVTSHTHHVIIKTADTEIRITEGPNGSLVIRREDKKGIILKGSAKKVLESIIIY